MKKIIERWQKSSNIKYLIAKAEAKDMELSDLAGYASRQGEQDVARTSMREALEWREEIKRLKKILETL
jgi:hypothetical protein